MEGKPIVFLEDIAGKLEETNDEWRQFLHIRTGAFLSFHTGHLDAAEDLESDDEIEKYSDWERDAIQEAADMLSHWEDYEELPSPYNIHEYRIMVAFAEAAPEPHREFLLVALNGRGAFRRFKDALIRAGLEQAWYVYRYSTFMEIAKEWCEVNQIAYKTKNEATG